MTTYKDFLGVNICIYDPILTDTGAVGGNTLGYVTGGTYRYTNTAGNGNVSNLTEHTTPQTMVLLNLHRHGPFGYPMWKQMRVSQNHLSRAHRLTNTFTYVQEPGAKIGDKQARYGDIVTLTEPVIAQNLPISVIGEVSLYNDQLGVFRMRPVELKTAFNNETEFFANKQANEYFNTILETDDNYEALIEMYLDGGLEDEGSMLDSFSLFTYRQTIWPKAQYAYLDDTRSRNHFVNTFWRSNRTDRRQVNADNGFSITVPSQSMWPLDAREDFATRTIPTINTVSFGDDKVEEYDIGGHDADNAESGPGILQNRYSSFTNGGFFFTTTGIPTLFGTTAPATPPSKVSVDNLLTSSAVYSRLHTLKNYYSPINPSGPKLPATLELKADFENSLATASTDAAFFSNHTASIFNGTAVWDAPRQSGKEPFYDSYSLFSEETRRKGKGFTKIPEFRISNHVEFYLNNSLEAELEDIFEISGALGQENATTSTNNFYKVLSNSDFLKHFDVVKSDHKDLAQESIIKIKCKAIKKLLPYKGFYPADRCTQLSQQFYESYKDGINPPREGTLGSIQGVGLGDFEQFATKPVIEPLFSPGILFNTIKSGVAVDWPIIFGEDYVSVAQSDDGDDETDPFSFDFSTRVFATERGIRSGSNATQYQTKFNNVLLGHTNNSNTRGDFQSMFTTRIPFEALVDPAPYLSNKSLVLQEPHPFALGETTISTRWTGLGDPLYKKMMSNFLAEVPDFFLKDEGMRTISSLEEQSPEFGNAEAGNFYLMRVKMTKSRNKANQLLGGYDGIQLTPPQDVVDQSGTPGSAPNLGDDKFTVRETLTMYSRPSAFGPPVIGDGKYRDYGGIESHLGSSWGYNFPYTPPYYHGESWCDLIFYADETKKYSLEEIMSQCREFPYYTRYWSPSHQDAMRDLTGYTGSSATGIYNNYITSGSQNPPWSRLIHSQSVRFPNLTVDSKYDADFDQWQDPSDLYPTSDPNTLKWAEPFVGIFSTVGRAAVVNQYHWYNIGPQSPMHVNNNAMQLSSSVNIFGKGTVKTMRSKSNGETREVASGDTVKGKTRWIIQPKFETPILNFNRFDQLEEYLNPTNQKPRTGTRKFEDPVRETCTAPQFAKSQVPRGMWHQYGDLPKENEGIYLQVSDIPDAWLRGALGVTRGSKKVKSLADLVGFSKEEVRLGEVANVKQISEAVVAVPFIEKDGTRKFFSIPRKDIDSCIGAVKREVDPDTFVSGGAPKAGNSVYQMVKNMQKYVFPPSMDFVRYKEIDPFAMYIFEFKHNLSKQDLSDIWQNLSPEIGTRMEEAEASISHELLAHELLGGGAVVKNGVLDDNAEGNGIPSNIQWMVFKAKRRAKTNYFDKVVAKKGTTEDTSLQKLENAQGQTGDDLGVTYNWPYDFFSLVELVKIDAEISFGNIENDDKGQKSIKKVESKKTRAPSMVNKARGKGRTE